MLTSWQPMPRKNLRRKASDVRDPEWPGARAVVFDRDLGRCVVCGHQAEDGHHRAALKSGGRSDPDRHSPPRVLAVSRMCHGLIHRRPEIAVTLGYIVPMGMDPTIVPVWYAAEKCWYTLTPGGTRLQEWMSKPEVLL